MNNTTTIGSYTVYWDIYIIKRRKRFPKCICKCGTINYLEEYAIKNRIRRCKKCYINERAFRDIIPGERFGKLTFTGHISKNKHSQDWIHCLCDCGKPVKTKKFDLLNGLIVGCGKACKISCEKTDLKEGERFGSWTVLSETCSGGYGANKLFQCQCICGTIKYQKAFTLRSGMSTACQHCEIKSKELELKPGEKYGSWTTTGQVSVNKYGNKIFSVICNCGFEAFRTKQGLTKGFSTQCKNCYIQGRWHQYVSTNK